MKLGLGHEMECPKCGTVYPQTPGDHGHLPDIDEAVELRRLCLELNRRLALTETRLRGLLAYVARTVMVPVAYSPERYGCLLCQEQAPRMSELKHGPECLLAPISDEPTSAPSHGGDFEDSDGGPLPECAGGVQHAIAAKGTEYLVNENGNQIKITVEDRGAEVTLRMFGRSLSENIITRQEALTLARLILRTLGGELA